MTQQTIWNADRMGRLELLYRDGYSCAVIANKIGVSKNAVVGKAHRMKLPRRVVIVYRIERRQPAKRPPSHRRRNRIVAIMKKKAPVIDPDRNYRCSILELTNETCRYPCWNLGTPHAERLYCGVPGADFAASIPYCEHHSNLCGTNRQN